MRRLLLATAAVLALAAGPAHASPPPVDARAYLVENAATGEVLAARDASEPVPIASITKLMTVLVALEHLRLDQVVTVSPTAARVGEESIYLRAGQRITVGDLVKGALIQSANDAADALAEAAAGGSAARFVGWMNAKARQLRLHQTHFERPDGLDVPGHVSSARDVLRLAQVAMRVPTIRDTVDQRSATIEDGTLVLHTWDDLLGAYPGVIGVKTGHTDDAGWCQVAALRRPGYTLYVVVLGSPSRARRDADLAALLRWGSALYRTGAVVAAGHAYARTEVGWGKHALPLVAARPLPAVYRVDERIVEKVSAAGAVALPVRRGQVLGRIQAWEGRRYLGSRPLVAGRSIPRPALPARVAWYARRTVHHILGFFS